MSSFLFSFLVSLLLVFPFVLSQTTPTFKPQPATFEASEFTKWNNLRRIEKSRKAIIDVAFKAADGSDDYVTMTRLDLVGDAHARGFAHGALLTDEIIEFLAKLDVWYVDSVLNINISQLPEPLQKLAHAAQLAASTKAPAFLKSAMQWVWDKEAPNVPQAFLDELQGMAEGVCHTMSELGRTDCDVDAWNKKLQQVNMMPELIRMACTAYGAWGKATASGGLIQLRALDFGSGPFANYTLIAVHRDEVNHPDHAFVSVAFPAFVGAITGVAQNGIGISEKVWMTYDKRDLQPGSYNGLADVFVLRYILENAKTKAEAEAYLQSVPRTWGMWVGVGDFASQTLDLVGYRQSDAISYTDVTMPSQTGMPYMEGVCYVDKHPQPSHDGPTGTLPTALSAFYGNITLDTTKIITQYHQTGDVHHASYDFKSNEMYLSIGRINHKGDYGPDGEEWRAYNRPSIKFNLQDFWNGH